MKKQTIQMLSLILILLLCIIFTVIGVLIYSTISDKEEFISTVTQPQTTTVNSEVANYSSNSETYDSYPAVDSTTETQEAYWLGEVQEVFVTPTDDLTDEQDDFYTEQGNLLLLDGSLNDMLTYVSEDSGDRKVYLSSFNSYNNGSTVQYNYKVANTDAGFYVITETGQDPMVSEYGNIYGDDYPIIIFDNYLGGCPGDYSIVYKAIYNKGVTSGWYETDYTEGDSVIKLYNIDPYTLLYTINL
jgi:hypothetical protein